MQSSSGAIFLPQIKRVMTMSSRCWLLRVLGYMNDAEWAISGFLLYATSGIPPSLHPIRMIIMICRFMRAVTFQCTELLIYTRLRWGTHQRQLLRPRCVCSCAPLSLRLSEEKLEHQVTEQLVQPSSLRQESLCICCINNVWLVYKVWTDLLRVMDTCYTKQESKTMNPSVQIGATRTRAVCHDFFVLVPSIPHRCRDWAQ